MFATLFVGVFVGFIISCLVIHDIQREQREKEEEEEAKKGELKDFIFETLDEYQEKYKKVDYDE